MQGDHDGGRCQQFEDKNVWAFFSVRTLLIIVFFCVIIQPGLSFRVNAAWDYSVSPLKQEKHDAGECARNVLVGLLEECPLADPLPVLFLESAMVF